MTELIQSGDSLNQARIKINPILALWNTGATGLNSIIADNGSGNNAFGNYSFSIGYNNIANLDFGTILGGSGNTSSGIFATVIGGSNNLAQGNYSFVLGGIQNSANTSFSTILNGQGNVAGGFGSSILAGTGHTIGSGGKFSAIIGGTNINLNLANTVAMPNLQVLNNFSSLTINATNFTSTTVTSINLSGTNANFINFTANSFSAFTANINQLIATGITATTLVGTNILTNNFTATTYYSGSTPLGNLLRTAQNIGTNNNSFGIYSGITGNTLFFKSISGSNNINITSSTTVVAINLDSSISANSISATTFYSGSTLLSSLFRTGLNIGNGVPIYSGITGSTLLFRSLSAGNYTNITSTTSELSINLNSNISASTISANTFYSGNTPISDYFGDGINLGSGTGGIYAGRTGTNGGILEFKNISGGTNINITSSTTEVAINLNSNIIVNSISANTFYSGSTSFASLLLSGTNIGTGAQILSGLSANTLYFRTLTSTPNILISSNTTGITFDINQNLSATTLSAGTLYSGSTNISNYFASGTNLGSGNIIYTGNSGTFNQNLGFKTLNNGTNITLTNDSGAIYTNLNNNISITNISAATFISGVTNISNLLPVAVNLGSGIDIYKNTTGVFNNNINFRTLSGGTNTTAYTDSTTFVAVLDLKPNINLTTITGGTIFSGITDIGTLFREGANIGISGSQNIFTSRTGNILNFNGISGGSNTVASTNVLNGTINIDLQPNINISNLSVNTSISSNSLTSTTANIGSITASSISATTIYNTGTTEVFQQLNNNLELFHSMKNGFYPKSQITDIFFTNQININYGWSLIGTPYPEGGIFALNGQNDKTQNGVYSAGTTSAILLTNQTDYFINYIEGSIFKVTGSTFYNNTFWFIPYSAKLSLGSVAFNFIQIDSRFINNSIIHDYNTSTVTDIEFFYSNSPTPPFGYHNNYNLNGAVALLTYSVLESIPSALTRAISHEVTRRYFTITGPDSADYFLPQDNWITKYDIFIMNPILKQTPQSGYSGFEVYIINNEDNNANTAPTYQFNINQKLAETTINSMVSQLLIPGNGNENSIVYPNNSYNAETGPVLNF